MVRWRSLYPFLAPLALLGLPLLAVAGLAVRGIEGDRAARQAQQVEAALARTDAAAARLEHAVAAVAETALRRVMAAAARPRLPLAALRDLTTRGTPRFAAVYQDERRLFPPEDSGAALPSEARMLVFLAGALDAARRRTAEHGAAWRWVSTADGQSLVHCRRGAAAGAVYCAVLENEPLRAAMTEQVRMLDAEMRPWTFVLTDPDGRLSPSGSAGTPPPLAEKPLGGALAGWRLQTRLAGGGVCRMDVVAFERIAGNLLDNARKFAAGTPVHIGTRATEGGVVLTVRDHGPGLAGADPACRGVGLGLAAVERLTAACGGGLRLEEACPGLRAVAWVRVIREA